MGVKEGLRFDYAGEVRIARLEVGRYGNNCYLLVDPEAQESAIVDPSAEAERILAAARGTRVRYILITHRHADHWGALQEVAAGTGGLVGIHPADAEVLPVPPQILVQDEDTLQVGMVPLRVIATPGHTAGSCCFLTGRHLFTGDTIFPGGPGHSDSPEALRQTIQSITRRLYVLPPQTIVYPGHGPGTTVGASREEYAAFASRPHPLDLHGDILWKES